MQKEFKAFLEAKGSLRKKLDAAKNGGILVVGRLFKPAEEVN